MKKSTLINKGDITTCWKCEGHGWLSAEDIFSQIPVICPLCNGSGKWVESHFIVIDEVNKIAIDSDTGG